MLTALAGGPTDCKRQACAPEVRQRDWLSFFGETRRSPNMHWINGLVASRYGHLRRYGASRASKPEWPFRTDATAGWIWPGL